VSNHAKPVPLRLVAVDQVAVLQAWSLTVLVVSAAVAVADADAVGVSDFVFVGRGHGGWVATHIHCGHLMIVVVTVLVLVLEVLRVYFGRGHGHGIIPVVLPGGARITATQLFIVVIGRSLVEVRVALRVDLRHLAQLPLQLQIWVERSEAVDLLVVLEDKARRDDFGGD